MAHSGDGTGWDTTAPATGDNISDGYKEVYDLRKGVAIRSDKEHEALAASSVGGEHLKGSAKAYYQDGEPTQRPDAVTNLTNDDAGRLLLDNDGATAILFKYFLSAAGGFKLAAAAWKIGTFTKNATPFIVNTVGFQPDFILLVSSGDAQHNIIKIAGMSGSYARRFNVYQNDAVEITATGFNMGSSALDYTYFYVAVKIPEMS